ncbi:STAS domain-containing protein [Hydrogenovibrio kuenenii]|uniref:STAS domain-containing protein n=1 Tax=Hydrogenovibrio kuenenii TaxID=63658 RepID=UPI0004630434|nr:STAS domain-containing protein [Hydrogenovibrio kuenenii]
MITHELKDQSLWIHVIDNFSIDDFNAFQAAHQISNFDQIVIDFSNATHIDSGGLGMLLQLRSQLGEDADQIILHSASEHILKIFEVVNFDKLFKIT